MIRKKELEFGMPTLIENRDIKEAAALCHELGLNFIELNMNLPQYQVDQIKKVQKLSALSEKYEIYYTIHLDENLNVCDFNTEVANAWINTVKDAIKIAKKLKIPILNMHMNKGVYFTMPNQRIYLFETYKEVYLERIKRFCDICEKEIGSEDIFISIENTNGYLPIQKKAIEILLESQVFSLTWDIGHSYVSGKMDETFLLEKKEYLKHAHIHDAIGTKNHLTLGTGEIHWQSIWDIINPYVERCVIETKTIESLRQSVTWLRKEYMKSEY